jgi:hypothetical protein
MPTYHYHIRKADHINATGGGDLHVHVYYDQGQSRRLIGRYRIPTLEPVFANKERELNQSEMRALRQWLAQPEQVKKLQDCLESTVFDLGKVASLVPEFGEVRVESGETYINIRIPVSRRLGENN